MVTGAALATINRLPVLLLPGDTFATRAPHPVLQQLEAPHDASLSVNDCFRPVSRFFERVERPEQLVPAALEAMRVLTDQADTGAVTLALPEDVQTEAFEVPEAFLAPRTWTVYRQPPAPEALARAVDLVRGAQRPLIVAGGGVIYSEATAALRALVDATGIPVAETQAGRGALPSEHPLSLGAVGATGTRGGQPAGPRRRPRHRRGHALERLHHRLEVGLPGSRRALRQRQRRRLRRRQAQRAAARRRRAGGARCAARGAGRLARRRRRGAPAPSTRRAPSARRCARLVAPREGAMAHQAAVIGAINDAAGETGVVVCAAGSAPGDLHKLWRARDPDGKGYHVEYGYSCMGYEIPGGMGVKLAAPERDVFVLVGDGSYLMMPGDLATAVAEGIAIVVVIVDNGGYASIGALSRSVGTAGFGTHYRRAENGGPPLDAADASGPAAPLRPARRPGGQRREPRRARAAGRGHRGAARRASTRPGATAAPSPCTSRSTATRACPATRAGGMCRWPRSQTTTRCAPRARSTSERGRRSAEYLETS